MKNQENLNTQDKQEHKRDKIKLIIKINEVKLTKYELHALEEALVYFRDEFTIMDSTMKKLYGGMAMKKILPSLQRKLRKARHNFTLKEEI